MDARVFWEFLRMLVDLRTADLTLSRNAEDDYQFRAGRISGFMAALATAGVVDAEGAERMRSLFFNANSHSGKRFPDRHNAGPHISLWDLWQRREQACEVIDVPSVEVPASSAPRVLHLLCMRGPCSAGGAPGRLQPVHTVQPVPPYPRVYGRWDYESGIRCLEAGLQYISCGTGVYLRETHARAPSSAVLARCVRQWKTDSLRSGVSPLVTDAAA